MAGIWAESEWVPTRADERTSMRCAPVPVQGRAQYTNQYMQAAPERDSVDGGGSVTLCRGSTLRLDPETRGAMPRAGLRRHALAARPSRRC